jgi:dTDP-4-amino-4,6-dideoxygalactose transaminase
VFSNEPISFLDLVSVHQELQPELLAVLQKCLSTAGFIGGPMVEEFEREFAQFCGTSHCVGVASGTDAVRFALTAAGVRAGDVVVTVPNTFIATTEAISQAGARQDFCDIDEQTYCMDPAKLQRYIDQECSVGRERGQLISRKHGAPVTAIVPVHLYGQVAEMDALLEIAREHHLLVVEDACQAHGAEYFSRKHGVWKKAGSMGHAAAFSFYPGKNLGACGEAGAVTTNSDAMARTMRMLRDHGQARKYYHNIEGYNGRLDAMQAGFLTAKLHHLVNWNDKRRQAAQLYDELFRFVDGVVRPFCPEWVRAVYHLYVIRVKDRDMLQKNLANSGIGTGIHYPVPLHLQEAYRHLRFSKGSFPISERVASEILSLPMFPQLGVDQIRRVVREVTKSLSSSPGKSPVRLAPIQPAAQA